MKFISKILAAACVVSLLTACGGSAGSSLPNVSTRGSSQDSAVAAHAHAFPAQAAVAMAQRTLMASSNPYSLLQNPNHGPIIAHPAANIVFWGWKSTDDPGFRSRLIGFLHDVGNSVWQHNIEQYGILNLANPLSQVAYMPMEISGAPGLMQIKDEVGPAASVVACCQHNSGVLFLVLPPGKATNVYNMLGPNSVCAYHDNAGGIPYVVLPDLPELGTSSLAKSCGAIAGQPDAIVSTAAGHEWAEALTDPQPGTGWRDDLGNGWSLEVGDLCQGYLPPMYQYFNIQGLNNQPWISFQMMGLYSDYYGECMNGGMGQGPAKT